VLVCSLVVSVSTFKVLDKEKRQKLNKDKKLTNPITGLIKG